MARDSAGTYSLPSSVNPVVTGTKITTAWAITTLNDIANALTGSLARDGSGAMTAGIKLFAGTVGDPGARWADELTSGWYRAGAGDFRYSIAGADAAKVLVDGWYTPDAAGGTMFRVGFRDIPQVVSSSVTASSAGKHMYSSGGTAWTISSGLPTGAAVTFINNGAAACTIASTDTLILAGPGTTGTRTLVQYGMATALKVGASTWFVSGTGLS